MNEAELFERLRLDDQWLECPECGFKYKDLRSGHTFAEVKQMLWVASDDPKDWVYRRRGTVLGKWRELKLEKWRHHLLCCATEDLDDKSLVCT